MAQATIIIGGNTKVFTIPEEAVKGVQFVVKEANTKAGTNQTVADYVAIMLTNWANDTINLRRTEYRRRLLVGLDAASPAVQAQVIGLLGVTVP